MKKAGMSYKKGGSKNKKKTMYKKGGMKKMAYGGRMKKANRGQAIGNWIDRTIDNVGGFAGNLYRDITDPIIGAADWFGDADRVWIPGTKDAWNIRPDDYKYSGRGWNKPGWMAGSGRNRKSSGPAPAPMKSDGYIPQSQLSDAEYDQMLANKRRKKTGNLSKMGGSKMKRYSDGGHVVPGKFLRQGPTRR
jgi:hypothetical protein